MKIANKCGFKKMLQGLKTALCDAVPQEHIFLFCFKASAKFANWSLGRKKNKIKQAKVCSRAKLQRA